MWLELLKFIVTLGVWGVTKDTNKPPPGAAVLDEVMKSAPKKQGVVLFS
jgi:hypothetical protein